MPRPDPDSWILRLEFEGHEHINRVKINGQTIGYLPSQTWADMWMSAALPVPAGLLRMGYNELTVEVGRVIPDCQAPGNAWDELLFRRVRLERVDLTRSAMPAPTPVEPAGSRPVTIAVLFDNNAYRAGLETAWGFAALVQRDGRSILFDTGSDGRMLLANMASLGLDPRRVDTIVLSHEHADHTGGLGAMLEENPGLTVYLPQGFSASFKERVRAAANRVVEVSGPVEIAPGVWSTGPMGESIVEQALVMWTESGLIVITGCAHPGIVAMVRRAREVGQGEISLVLGGLHLNAASTATLQDIVADLRGLDVRRIAPCHCSGKAATALLENAFGEGYQHCGAGLILQEGR